MAENGIALADMAAVPALDRVYGDREVAPGVRETAPTNLDDLAAIVGANPALSASLTEQVSTATAAATTATTKAGEATAAAAAVAAATPILAATWATLNAIVGTYAGQPARCTATAGTHNDPVTGTVGVNDGGEYAWSTAPAGWRRVGDIVALTLADAPTTVAGTDMTKGTHPAGVKAAMDARIRDISPRSGYSVALGEDPSGRVPGGFDAETGHFIYFGEDVHDVIDPVKAAALRNAVFPSADISIIGDSLVENYPGLGAYLAGLFTAAGETRSVFQYGLGGQGLLNILGRQGGYPARITFPNGANGLPEIPASGTVSVAVTNNPLNHPGTANAEQIDMTGTVQVGPGVGGTLRRQAGGANYQFIRGAAGAAMAVPPGLPFMPSYAQYLNRIQLGWGGTNDLSPGATTAPTIFARVKMMADAQTPAKKRFVAIMPTWDMATYGSTRRALYDELLGYYKDTWPTSTIDIIGLLQPLGNGSANDNADVAANIIPRSLQSADRLHFPAGGAAYQAILTEVFNVIRRNGW